MVITSNISTKYLPGLLVGYVSEISLDANQLTQSGFLVPVADFDHLTHVIIIKTLKSDMMIDGESETTGTSEGGVEISGTEASETVGGR